MKNELPQLSYKCPENWNEMSVAGEGRHCSKCNIVVTDFSKMSNDEILSTLKNSSDQHSCGSFKAYQLREPFNDKRNILIRFYQQTFNLPKRNYFLRSFQLGLAAILLMATGCHRRMTGYRSAPSDVRHISQQGKIENVSGKSFAKK